MIHVGLRNALMAKDYVELRIVVKHSAVESTRRLFRDEIREKLISYSVDFSEKSDVNVFITRLNYTQTSHLALLDEVLIIVEEKTK